MAEVSEQDEFLLSELLDGHLPAVEAEQLQKRIAAEPELREAYKALERVHSFVGSRSSDQPSVDWAHFHRRVMERVQARRVLRFPRWVAISVPLAAAAAVALVVLIERRPGPEAAPDNGPIDVVVTAPVSGNQPGELSVTIERPAVPPTSPTAPIDVAYTRSAEMDELIRRLDEERSSQPSSYVSKFLQAPEPEPTIPSVLEEPPL